MKVGREEERKGERKEMKGEKEIKKTGESKEGRK